MVRGSGVGVGDRCVGLGEVGGCGRGVWDRCVGLGQVCGSRTGAESSGSFMFTLRTFLMALMELVSREWTFWSSLM